MNFRSSFKCIMTCIETHQIFYQIFFSINQCFHLDFIFESSNGGKIPLCVQIEGRDLFTVQSDGSFLVPWQPEAGIPLDSRRSCSQRLNDHKILSQIQTLGLTSPFLFIVHVFTNTQLTYQPICYFPNPFYLLIENILQHYFIIYNSLKTK